MARAMWNAIFIKREERTWNAVCFSFSSIWAKSKLSSAYARLNLYIYQHSTLHRRRRWRRHRSYSCVCIFYYSYKLSRCIFLSRNVKHENAFSAQSSAFVAAASKANSHTHTPPSSDRHHEAVGSKFVYNFFLFSEWQRKKNEQTRIKCPINYI